MELPNERGDNTEETIVDHEEKETDEDIRPKQSSQKIRQRQPRNQISSDAKSTECPECGKEFTQRQGSTIPQRCIESPQQIIGRFMISKQIYSK